MFTKIMIPSDGSVLGNIAAIHGIETAAKLKAEVVGVTVIREYQKPGFGKKVSPTREEFEAEAKESGKQILKPLEDAAKKAGIKFQGMMLTGNHPAQNITHAASENNCDLIFIGSHGCAGWDHVLMGSVSNKVLATSKVPVLVYRLKEDEVPEDVPHSYDAAFPPA